MAFQESISTSEDSSPAHAHYLLSFSGIVDSPRLYGIDNQAAQPSPLRTPSRSNILLAGEIVPWPVSERCLPASASDFRGASLRGDVGSSVIRCLPSSSDYDSSHPSLDAHSRSAPLIADFVKIESFILGEFMDFFSGFVSMCSFVVSGLGTMAISFVVARTAC